MGIGSLSIADQRYFIVGGAGFIGGHFTDRFLADPSVRRVTVFDNFSSGREWHLDRHKNDSRLEIVRADVKELDRLTAAMEGHDRVIHLASNPDIAAAVTNPSIDFYEGTLLTHCVVEAMRRSGVDTILYASGSGVYGDLGECEVAEDHGPMVPISTYGASKLAGEVLIAAYCNMFDLAGRVFRFGNVVGPRQTHGVGFDFARRLLDEPTRLEILGDGTQSKSYVHVDDVMNAVLTAADTCTQAYRVFNVGTGDYVTVTEIADIAVECVGLEHGSAEYVYTGGDRGWKGDVPVMRLDTDRIKSLGWVCARSTRQAIADSIRSMIDDMRSGVM